MPTKSFAVVKINSPNFYMPAINFLVHGQIRLSASVAKTDTPNLYRLPTRYTVVKNGLCESLHALLGVKIDSTNFYSLPTRFEGVKTDSLNIYNITTGIAEVKTDY